MSNRACQQCGTPLAPGQEFCGNCGAHYSEPGTLDATQRAASYPGAGAPGVPPIAPTQYAGPWSSPASPYDSSPYDSKPYGSASTSYGSQGQSYAPPPPPPPPNVPYAGAPGAYGQQQPGQPVGGFPQAPQPKKGPNVGLIIGIIALIVVVIGAGVFFVTRSRGGSTNNPSNPSPGINGTTIPTALPTPQALFSGNFADNSQGWATGNSTGFSRTIGNNALILDDHDHKILPESLPTSTTFNNFSVTMDFTFTQGDQNDGAGLYVRGDSNLDHDYRVEVYQDSTYAIVKEYLDSSNNPKAAILVDVTGTSSLKPVGQQNKMTVIMKGTTLVLLINDTLVKTITDSNYTSGQIALFVQNGSTSNGVKASFSSVAVYPAPNQLPS